MANREKQKILKCKYLEKEMSLWWNLIFLFLKTLVYVLETMKTTKSQI